MCSESAFLQHAIIPCDSRTGESNAALRRLVARANLLCVVQVGDLLGAMWHFLGQGVFVRLVASSSRLVGVNVLEANGILLGISCLGNALAGSRMRCIPGNDISEVGEPSHRRHRQLLLSWNVDKIFHRCRQIRRQTRVVIVLHVLETTPVEWTVHRLVRLLGMIARNGKVESFSCRRLAFAAVS